MGGEGSTVTRSAAYALEIGGAESEGAARFLKWNAEEEAARLEEFRRSLSKAVSQFEKLPLPIRSQLVAETGDRRMMPLGAYAALKEAETAINSRIHDARRAVLQGSMNASEKAYWRSLAVYEECRSVWRAATGKEPPKYISNNEPGPFARFLSDVLEALETPGTPEGLAALWRRHFYS